jgi:predicted MFS family arabinose efflux permease
MTGATTESLGFPFLMKRLYAEYGFGWSTRALALIYFGIAILANLLMRQRLKPNRNPPNARIVDFTSFTDIKLLLVTTSTFFARLGWPLVTANLVSYALSKATNPQLASLLPTFLAAESFVGRILGGYLVDVIGPYIHFQIVQI